MRVALNEVVAVGLDVAALKTLLEGDCGRLSVVMGDDNRTDHKATVLELATQTQHILVVGDAQVGALLVLLNVGSTDDNHYLYAVAYLLKHAQLAVGLETRQHAACMMVVEEFATKFEVQFSIKLRNSLLDVLRLNVLILFVIKSDVHNCLSVLVH